MWVVYGLLVETRASNDMNTRLIGLGRHIFSYRRGIWISRWVYSRLIKKFKNRVFASKIRTGVTLEASRFRNCQN